MSLAPAAWQSTSCALSCSRSGSLAGHRVRSSRRGEPAVLELLPVPLGYTLSNERCRPRGRPAWSSRRMVRESRKNDPMSSREEAHRLVLWVRAGDCADFPDGVGGRMLPVADALA